MDRFFNKPKYNALQNIKALRKRLLQLYDCECRGGKDAFDEVYGEIRLFAENLFSSTVPKELSRLEQTLHETGYVHIKDETIEQQLQFICQQTVVAIDELLDEWATKIKRIGLPKIKSAINTKE
ncbi:MAG: hypothetical protein ACTSW4_00795 [Candidatus Ranarchaeia archaeon]